MTKKMIIPAVMLFIAAILIYSMGGSAVAYAEGNEVLFDSTYVLDDLEGSAVNGVTFRVEDYPYDPDGELQLIGFTEYGFSAYANLQQNFGLYIYLYNPALLDISNYYQTNVCNNHTDIMLFRFGRGKGAMITEAHIIKRTSKNRYLVMSFDFDTVYVRSLRTVEEVCTYILKEFVPMEFRRFSWFDRLWINRVRRLRRSEEERSRLGMLSNELTKDSKDLERLIRLHQKSVDDLVDKLTRGGEDET